MRASSTHSSLNSKESESTAKRRSDTSTKNQGMNSIYTSVHESGPESGPQTLKKLMLRSLFQ